jgi:hypothetical protein
LTNKKKPEAEKAAPKVSLFLDNLETIIQNDCSTDPQFKTEELCVKLTLDEIKKRLIDTYGYTDGCPSRNSIANILNKNGYKFM